MKQSMQFLMTVCAAAALAGCAGTTASQQKTAAPAVSQQVAAAVTPEVKEAKVTRATVAPALYELAYSAKQNAVFVASAGGMGKDAPKSKILRLNAETLAVEAEIELAGRAFGVVLDDDLNRLYVGNGLEGSLTVFDTAKNAVLTTIPLAKKVKGEDGKESFEHHFRELVLDKANNRLFAPGLSVASSSLYVVDTKKLQLEKVIPGFGSVAVGVSLDHANNRLFVSNLRGGLYAVNSQTLELTKGYSVGADQLINLAFAQTSKRLWATDQGLAAISERRQKVEPEFKPTPGNRVVAFNPDTAEITASIPTGDGPIALLLDEPRKRLFVTNRGSGTVTVLDTDKQAVVKTIELPAHPNSLTFDPVNDVLYVSIKNGREAERGSAESIARIAF